MSHMILRSSPSVNDTLIYLKWLEKVETQKSHICRKLGIFNLIQLSKTMLEYDENLILAAMYFWESSTNTMQLKCGMLTPTFLDMATITRISGKVPPIPSNFYSHFNWYINNLPSDV